MPNQFDEIFDRTSSCRRERVGQQQHNHRRDRAKIIEKTRNRVDLAVNQGPFWMKLELSCRSLAA